MTYTESIEYLNCFVNYEHISSYDYKTSFKFERMARLLEILNNPHKYIKTIHIAGTKGKGSTAAIVSSVLQKAGFKTGLYTSPHLVSFRERIKINQDLIKEEDIAALVKDVKEAVDKSKENGFTFFELYTAVAFLYFKLKKVDLAIIEVGLGGRLDATNVVNPLVACITPISLDHTQHLGSTLEEIATEKAAIIKKGCVCVSGVQADEVKNIIKNRCNEEGVRLYEADKDIFYKSLGVIKGREHFNIKTQLSEYNNLEMGLLGEHQLENAATAIGIIESLRTYDISIPSECIKEGIKDVNWPGRLEVLSKKPLTIVDGAQNKASAAALKKAIKTRFKFKRLILILGISKDKDIKGICEELTHISSSVILTKAQISRAEDPDRLKSYLRNKIYLTDNISEAITLSKRIAKDGDLVLITGSLFVVGEAREILEKRGKRVKISA